MTTELPRRLEVFFYGLFMDEDFLRAKGLQPIRARRGHVHGMAVMVGKRVALAVSSGSAAPGMVMQLTHAEIERLYSEPSVTMYKPEAVLVDLADGGKVAALCFNLPASPAPTEQDAGYLEELRDLRRRLGPEE
jgi:Gamma-glutamyl cyclotransferase, AIG2-like